MRDSDLCLHGGVCHHEKGINLSFWMDGDTFAVAGFTVKIDANGLTAGLWSGKVTMNLDELLACDEVRFGKQRDWRIIVKKSMPA